MGNRYHGRRLAAALARPARSVVLALLGLAAHGASAAQVSVSLADIQTRAIDDSNPLDAALAEQLNAELGGPLSLEGETLLYRSELTEQWLDDSCNGSKLRSANIDISLPTQSLINFQFESVLRPISLGLSTRAQVQISGTAVQYVGIGNRENCSRIGSDSFDFSVDGEIDIELGVSLDPGATLVDATELQLQPSAQVSLGSGQQRIDVKIDRSLLKGVLERRLSDAIDDALTAEALDETARSMAADLQLDIEAELGVDGLSLRLPDSDAEFGQALRQWIGEESAFPLSDDYMARNGEAIVQAALVGNRDSLEELLGGLIACQVGALYLKDLPREPLYRLENGACNASDSLQPPLFGDASCAQSVAVQEQSLSDYCRLITDPLALGDGGGAGPQVQQWQLSPGTRLGITLPGFDDQTRQPYQGSVTFAQRNSERGLCELEMRIYTPRPGAQNLRPVIALHGGSWSQRGGGFVGMESLLAHFSSRDMLVFAPFYRLVGDQDGPTACRQFVAEDLIADAEAALDWVLANGADYGAGGDKVALFGQSAGGFLASWLAVNRAADVDAALLMYPPTDVSAFVDDLRDGTYSNERGVGILERFLGVERDGWSAIPDRLAALSAASQVSAAEVLPAVRMIHGDADDLVLPSQSERLCDALHGGRAPTETPLLRISRRACGERGQLDIIEGAEHALEVCAPGTQCKAGDLISATAAQTVLREAYDWLATEPVEPAEETGGVDNPVADSETAEASSGGGGGAMGALLLGCLALRRRSVGPREGVLQQLQH